MAFSTDRFALPLLASGQAQKEITHNEALTLIDVLVQPIVVAVAPAAVPAAPQPGQCWIVGTAPSGAWAGQAGAIAAWTGGGWRFIAAVDGMTVWSIADGVSVRRIAGVWQIGTITANRVTIGGQQVVGPRTAAIANPNGGSTSDSEARAAIAAILASLRTHGLIAT